MFLSKICFSFLPLRLIYGCEYFVQPVTNTMTFFERLIYYQPRGQWRRLKGPILSYTYDTV